MEIPSIFSSLAKIVTKSRNGEEISAEKTHARAIGLTALALHHRAERIANRWAPHDWRDARVQDIRDAATLLADCAEKMAIAPRGYHPLVRVASVGDSVDFARYFVADPDGHDTKSARGGKQIRGTWRTTGDCALHAKRLGAGPYIVTEVEQVEIDGAIVAMVTAKSSSGRSVTLAARAFAVSGTTEADEETDEETEAAAS